MKREIRSNIHFPLRFEGFIVNSNGSDFGPLDCWPQVHLGVKRCYTKTIPFQCVKSNSNMNENCHKDSANLYSTLEFTAPVAKPLYP